MDHVLCLWSISPSWKSSKKRICWRMCDFFESAGFIPVFSNRIGTVLTDHNQDAAFRSWRVSREWISCLRHRRSKNGARPRGWLRTDSGEAAWTSAETPGTSPGIDIKLSQCRYSAPQGRRPVKFTNPSLACCENSGCISHRPIRQNALGNYYFNFDALLDRLKHIPVRIQKIEWIMNAIVIKVIAYVIYISWKINSQRDKYSLNL